MRLYNRNGVLWFDIRIDGERVRQSTKLPYTPDNIRLFKNHMKKDKFFEKFNVKKDVPTVIELCNEILLEKEEVLKSSSYSTYLSLFDSQIIPYFDKKLISEIEPKDIDTWYRTFSDRSTLKTCEAILKPAFNKAVLRKYIENTPFIVDKPKFKNDYVIQPLSIDEFKILEKESSGAFKNFIGISFFTGIRTGELLALKWDDVNFDNFTISINKTVTRGFVQSPKTESSIRVIDMLTQCEYFFKEQRKITGLGGYVFLGRKGEIIKNSSNFNYHWKKLLQKCKLPSRGIYQLRHSFASNMLSNGEDLMWVSAMLGHKSANITLEKYTKYIRRKRERKTTFFDDVGTKMAH